MSRAPKQPRREEQQQATQEAQRREGGTKRGGGNSNVTGWSMTGGKQFGRFFLSHGTATGTGTPLPSLSFSLSLSSPAAAGGTAEGRQQLSSRSTTSFLELAARRGG